MKRLTAALLIIMVSLVFVPYSQAQASNLLGLIAQDGRLSTLEAAIKAAGLTETFSSGSWTIFAPTNDAFARIGITADNVADKYTPEELQFLLTYHAVPGSLSMADAKAKTGDVTMANGRIAGWKWFDNTLYINDDARVIARDTLASNGTLHIVDTVIQGPWPKPAAPANDTANAAENVDIAKLTIVDYLEQDGRFSTTAAAVEYAGLTEMLSSGIWTFFAPTNQAFSRIGVNRNNLHNRYTPEGMRNFLLYHIYPAHMSIAKARTMLGDITMANGQLAGTKWYRRNLWVNDTAQVAVADLHVQNGVIHGVRNVILPPWPRVELPPEPQNSGLIE